MSENLRYSDEELQEFKELILQKLEKAQADYDLLKSRFRKIKQRKNQGEFAIDKNEVKIHKNRI